jgi:hypothetical protein
MKKLISILITICVLISCESTEEPKKDLTFQLIGKVYLQLFKISDNGQTLGEFYCGYYLSSAKIQLIQNNQVIETTFPVKDSICDAIYILKKVEYNKPYKIAITLNDEISDTTEEFTITKNDVKYFPYDSLTQSMINQFPWLEKGNYFTEFLNDSPKNIIFNLYSDRTMLNVFPNPVINYGNIEFTINQESSIEVNINKIDKSFNIIAHRGFTTPGKLSIQFGDNLDNGLYFVKLIGSGQTFYCPFLKGSKGSPM